MKACLSSKNRSDKSYLSGDCYEKKILGIDPGSTTIGYGVLSYKNSNAKPLTVGYGYIDLKKYHGQHKLLQLHKDLKELIKQYKPDCMAVENVYFFKNAKTITTVMQSKGVILLTAAMFNVTIHEYTPLQIKQTISGYGRADKKFIQKLVQSSLAIKSDIKPDDASDALAIALCHLRHLTSL